MPCHDSGGELTKAGRNRTLQWRSAGVVNQLLSGGYVSADNKDFFPKPVARLEDEFFLVAIPDMIMAYSPTMLPCQRCTQRPSLLSPASHFVMQLVQFLRFISSAQNSMFILQQRTVV